MLHYFALFTFSAKCRFQTSEGYKSSNNDCQSMFKVQYRLLTLVSEEIAGLGFARCQRLLRIHVDGVDLRLTPVANGVASLYGGYMSIIQFLYSCFNSFQSFLRVSHVSCCFPLFSRFCGRDSSYSTCCTCYFSLHWFNISLANFSSVKLVY